MKTKHYTIAVLILVAGAVFFFRIGGSGRLHKKSLALSQQPRAVHDVTTTRPNIQPTQRTETVRSLADEIISSRQVSESNPIKAQIRTQQTRRSIESHLMPIIENMGFDADQLAKIRKLLVERSDTIQDLISLSAPQKLSTQAFNAERDAALAPIVQQLKEVAGDDRYSEIEKVINLQASITSIEGTYALDMSYNGVPLSKNQIVSLAVLDQSINKPIVDDFNQTRALAGYDEKTGLSELDRAAVTQAASFLSPAQLTVYKSALELRERSLASQLH